MSSGLSDASTTTAIITTSTSSSSSSSSEDWDKVQDDEDKKRTAFRVGDKLEAIDPDDPRWMHVATITVVISGGAVGVTFDGAFQHHFLSHPPHRHLAPAGTCERFGMLLQGPEETKRTMTPRPFTWADMASSIAPVSCFEEPGFHYDNFVHVYRINGELVPEAPPIPSNMALSLTLSRNGGCFNCMHKTHVCNICLTLIEDTTEVAWSCGIHDHTFCRLCLLQYMLIAIESNSARHLRCPMHYSCSNSIRKTVIESLLSGIDLERWRAQEEVRVDSLAWHIRCPQANCGYPLAITDLKNYKSAQCGVCRFEVHFSRKQIKAVDALIDNPQKFTDAEIREKVYLILNTKPCPHCKVPIERDGGCDHMTCNRCSASFCWQCGEIMRSSSKMVFGSHTDRFQLWGCPERLCRNNRALCYATRTAIFTGKVTAAIVAGPPLLVGSLVFYAAPKAFVRGVRKIQRRRT